MAIIGHLITGNKMFDIRFLTWAEKSYPQLLGLSDLRIVEMSERSCSGSALNCTAKPKSPDIWSCKSL